MKTTYEFTQEDENQRQVFEKAHAFYSALWDISGVIREHQKYEAKTAEETIDAIREIVSYSGMWEIN